MPETDDMEWPPHLDAMVAAPANHRILFEDDAVRVLEVSVAPGERESLHHHRWPSIMVVLARPNYRNFDASASCGKVDPVFRLERCASQENEHRSGS